MHPETGPRGEPKPFSLERGPDGTETYTVRAKRPKIAEVWQEARGGKQEILADVESFADESGASQMAAVFGGDYDYQKIMGEVGSPESVEMADNPPLTVGFVRHLAHVGNVVSPENLAAFEPKAQQIVDDLHISEADEVYVIASPSGQFAFTGLEENDAVINSEVVKNSRTSDTAGVIKSVLTDRGIKFSEKIDPRGDESGAVDSALFKALQEFDIVDEARYAQAVKEGLANLKASKAGEPRPFPEAPSLPPVAYASHAPDVKDLMAKTGMAELSSATVARTLKGLDALEEYFLKGRGQSDKRKVVILCGHGQFATDITEAFQETTSNDFPVMLAGNGDYFTLDVGLNPQDQEPVEEYHFTRLPATKK